MDNIPHCIGMQELPDAHLERSKLSQLSLELINDEHPPEMTPLFIHLSHGLAYTQGSALGSIPPTTDACLSAFIVTNKAGLTAGGRAWSKHFHRSQSIKARETGDRKTVNAGWWGSPAGPVSVINDGAVALFWRIIHAATWRNLHWLPHQVLVYEIRVPEGYGIRWSQDKSIGTEGSEETNTYQPWVFRGFLEPQMENGHELGWRHD
ncbi:hypothetical protein H0H93_002403 [Arthromyces matolae]|nr:hypothetical protein H0H93_002403 [Arthromyces matolae]